MTSDGKIFKTLEKLGLTAPESREIFATGTRDRPDLTVYRDSLSGVVFIDDFYVGDTVYEAGDYRQQTLVRAGSRDFELQADVERRAEAYKQFYTGRTVTEFGCGEGAFLRDIADSTVSVTGVELQQDYVAALNADGIACFRDTGKIREGSQEAVFAFHVLEHLPDPLAILDELLKITSSGGVLVLEVPHASDMLLSMLKLEAFKSFTLWSQHLVLHTRESLRRMLQVAGFSEVTIEGVQRYPLSNHLHWLSEGKPGGHKGVLSALDTPELKSAYEAALRKIDATDTLVAVCRKP